MTVDAVSRSTGRCRRFRGFGRTAPHSALCHGASGASRRCEMSESTSAQTTRLDREVRSVEDPPQVLDDVLGVPERPLGVVAIGLEVGRVVCRACSCQHRRDLLHRLGCHSNPHRLPATRYRLGCRRSVPLGPPSRSLFPSVPKSSIEHVFDTHGSDVRDFESGESDHVLPGSSSMRTAAAVADEHLGLIAAENRARLARLRHFDQGGAGSRSRRSTRQGRSSTGSSSGTG